MNIDLPRLLHGMAWAARRTIESLRATPAAQGEATPLLAHMLAAEHVWLSRLRRSEPQLAVWPTLTLDECAALAAENEAGYAAWLEVVDAAGLESAIRYRTSQGDEFETSVCDILMQVATHGPYHRGQIAKIVARHGGAAAATDWIVFVRENPVRA